MSTTSTTPSASRAGSTAGQGGPLFFARPAFRVKAHEEYNGQRQTVLTRCKFEDTVERQNDWQTWQEAVPAK